MANKYTITDTENGGLAVTAPYNAEWKAAAQQLRGKWDPARKAWVFGPRKRDAVLKALEGIDWNAVQEPPPKRRWIPCGYPGCRPGLCDDCDGRGALYDFRGRRIN